MHSNTQPNNTKPFLQRWRTHNPWLRNRDLFYITLASAFAGFSVDGGIFNVIFNLYLLRLGYEAQAVGQINSAADLTFAVVSLPLGILGNRWGNRTLMLWGAIAMCIGCGATAGAGLLPQAMQMIGLMVSKSLIYFGLSAFFVNQVPYVIAKCRHEYRQQVFAASSALNSSGAFFGSLIGGLIPAWYATWMGVALHSAAAYSAPLWVVTVVMLGMVILTWLAKPEGTATAHDQHDKHDKTGEPTTEPQGAPNFIYGFMAFFVVMNLLRFLHVGGISSVMGYFNVYLDKELHVPTSQIGLVAAMGRLAAIPAVLLTPLLVRRWPRPWVSFWAAILMALCVLPIALLPTWWAAGVSFMLMQATMTIRYSAFIVYLMELTPPHQRGLMTGAGEMAAALGGAVFTLTGGYIITQFGYSPLFLLGGLLILIGTLLFGGYVWREEKRRT